MRLYTTISILLLSNFLFAQKPLYFDKLNDFKNGYALVQTGNLKGFIDVDGNLIGKLDVIQTLDNGTDFQGKTVYLQRQFGFHKDAIRKFTGEFILNPSFSIQTVNSFFIIKDFKNLSKPTFKIMNENGQIIFSVISKNGVQDPILPISNELIGIKNLDDKYSKYYAIKSLVSDFKSDYNYKKFKKLKNGFIKAFRYSETEGKNKWGFLNSKGEVAIDFMYSYEPSDFNENKAIVKNIDNLFGYIDNDNKIILEPQFVEASKFVNGKAIVRLYNHKKVNNITNYGYRLINEKGEILFDFKELRVDKKYDESKYDIIENGNLIKLKHGSKISLFNVDNFEIKETPYNSIGEFDSNLALVVFKKEDKKKMGYINEKGELVFCTETKNQF
ncbi:hypothetical protein FHS04_000795 [Mesoflavibacter sabulilitoris]|uniref:WG repeat-containing protein n=1 Tax=Mesoflavibacter zeaxanthinifaciens subsp. sabulilitoris TaxID=1520893 RepID=A0A2T1N648_9FLAO|nr:WG repeat-containing protein [Mesoflavibacter zeaxanthinifaciens]MBB3123298.1 hypothetical protein [Mesoflavibacter zeaxanthinifaciens subsp. sabulilitoris]PSG87065.1 hypothetical protein C7H61_13220 [Mesoflavibacter zeaxanthinifaciens subsp. sabulilitoris]